MEPPNPTDKAAIKITCKDDINTVSANVGSTLAYICPTGCADVTSIKVYGTKDNKFSEHSSICRSAAYLGLINDNEESIIKIKVSKLKTDFVPAAGESNNIKSEKCPEITSKLFEFVLKTMDEECPNLSVKKSSFISFDEIVKKVENKKNP